MLGLPRGYERLLLACLGYQEDMADGCYGEQNGDTDDQATSGPPVDGAGGGIPVTDLRSTSVVQSGLVNHGHQVIIEGGRRTFR
jgi:hypothetical protein